MRGLFRDNLFEALVGLLVVLLAAWFVFFAWQRTGGSFHKRIQVTALFPAANGISTGTDVRVAGLKVGTVTGQKLDPQSYQAEVTLSLDSDVKMPSDSSAAITSEGLLGGTYVALVPGGSDQPLRNGDMILDTQGSIDMMGLIGSLINNSGSVSGGDADAKAGSTMMEESPAQ